MSEDNEIIRDAEIGYRINEGATSFSANLVTPVTEEELDVGDPFEFYIYDNTLYDLFVAVKGMVETVKIDNESNGLVYAVSGRDVGLSLVTQPFSLPCTETLSQQFTVEDALEWIFDDTTITTGRGQTPLSRHVALNTAENNSRRFCGSWNTKEEAINQLFSQYCKVSGAKRIRWYINYAGYFRWFETNTTRGTKEYIFMDDDRILDYNIEKDITGVVNVISGTYGDEEDGHSITMTEPASISAYGRRVGSDINEQKYTLSQLQAEIQKELDMKAWPIYSGTITFFGVSTYEVGTQLMFPENHHLTGVTLTVVDYKINCVDGAVTTTINVTSDESSISIPNEFDVIEAAVEQKVNDAKLTVGVVTSIPDKSDDRGLVFTPSKTGGVIKNARNPGGQWR